MSETKEQAAARPDLLPSDYVPVPGTGQVLIVPGLRVWTSNVQPGTVTRVRAHLEGTHDDSRKAWWHEVVEDRGRVDTMDGGVHGRMGIVHPFTGKKPPTLEQAPTEALELVVARVDDDDLMEKIMHELGLRSGDEPHEDTPSLDPPWWEDR